MTGFPAGQFVFKFIPFGFINKLRKQPQEAASQTPDIETKIEQFIEQIKKGNPVHPERIANSLISFPRRFSFANVSNSLYGSSSSSNASIIDDFVTAPTPTSVETSYYETTGKLQYLCTV